MANYATLKAAIDAVIKANGHREITGTVLNQTLNAMVNSLGANYQLAGVATPSTNPGTPDQNVFYLAFEAGTYTNFNATVLSAGISIFMWNGSWSSQTFYTIDATPTASSNNLVSSGAVFDAIKTDGSAYDVSAHFPTGGPNNDGKFTLEYILSNANTLIPTAWRKGGMSIRFVQSSDNKYVQYRLMSQEFSTYAVDWEGTDDEIVANSNSLVRSKNVYPMLLADSLNYGTPYYPNIKGSYISSSDGSIVLNLAAYRTDFIPLDSSSDLAIFVKGLFYSPGYLIAFFDENKNVLPTISIRGIGNYETYFISIDSQAKYVVLSVYAEEYQRKSELILIKKDTIFNYLNENIFDALEKSTSVTNIKKIPSIDGYVTSLGYFSNDSYAKRTDYIFIKGLKSINYRTKISSGGYAIAFYNKYKMFLPSISILGSGAETRENLQIPSEAYYLIFSNYNGSDPYVEIYNEGNIQSTTEYLYKKVNALVDLNIKPSIDGYVTSTGQFSVDPAAKRTDYIFLDGFSKVQWSCFLTNGGYSIAFYDENKIFLPSISILGSGAVNNLKIDIPNTAKYLIFSAYIPEQYNTYVKLISSDSDLINLNNLTNILYLEELTFSAFQKFGVIGDSLSVGHATNTATGTQYGRNIASSWGQIIARKYGNICLNFGFTGATCKTWYDSNEHGWIELQQSQNLCQCYIVGIGTNDKEEIGSISDIDWSDRDNNANTFYGNYAKILQAINDVAPMALIFVLTIPYPRNNNSKNNAIKEIVQNENLNHCYLVDLEQYDDLFSSKYIMGYYKDSHYSAAGYANCGNVIVRAISRIMNENSENADIRNITYIPFGNNNIIN